MTVRVAAAGGGPSPSTANLVTTAQLTTHEADTTNVHGFADTALVGIGGGSPAIVAGGNLGATPSVNLGSDTYVWHTGTLTAHATLAMSGFEAGNRLELHYAQNGTGGWTLTLNDGLGGSPLLLDLPTTASEKLKVGIEWVSNTEYRVDIPGSTESAGHTIYDETTPLTARSSLSFVGSGLSVRDDSASDRSVVEVNSPNFMAPEDNLLKSLLIPLTAASTTTQQGAEVYYYRWTVRKRIVVSEWVLRVTTAGTSMTSAWMALYDSTLTTLLAKATGLTTADGDGWASTGNKVHGFDTGLTVTLDPGLYFLAMNATTAATRPSFAAVGFSAGLANLGLATGDGFAAARSAGGASSPAASPGLGVGAVEINAIPAVGLR